MTTETITPARVSSTLLGAAERCMLLAKAERENPAGSAPASAGRVFHEVAAVVATHAYALDLREVPVRDALRIANTVIRSPEEPTGLARHDANRVRGMVARWARWAKFDTDADVFAIEIPLVTEMDGVLFSGRIDHLTIHGDRCTIKDYKTSQHVPTQAEVEEHSQLPSYAVHAAARWPHLRTFELEEVYVTRQPTPRPVYVEDTDLPALEDWMLDVHGRVSAAYARDEFDTAPGPWCSNCTVSHTCPVPAEARPVTTLDDAVEAAERLVVNTRRVKADQAAIKAYLDGAGVRALHIGDSRVGWRETSKRELNKRALADAMLDGGVELEDFYETKPGREFRVAA